MYFPSILSVHSLSVKLFSSQNTDNEFFFSLGLGEGVGKDPKFKFEGKSKFKTQIYLVPKTPHTHLHAQHNRAP